MGTHGPGRKRIPNRERLSAEGDALNLIAREAEARLAAKRAARAEAREIRMKELERQQKEASDEDERMSVGSRGSLRIEERPEKDFIEKGPRSASSLSATTLASLGGTSSRRGSGDTSISVDTEASLREFKDSLAEVEEKYKKAMVSNAQLDNEKANLMYQVDILKDALMELEEQLAETRREYDEKCKENERQKHAYSVLQYQFNEVNETIKQREEMLAALERQKEYFDAIRSERDELREELVRLKEKLKKHGIAVAPEVVANGEASVSMNEIEAPLEPVPAVTQEMTLAQQEASTGQLGRAKEVEMKSEILENVEIMQNTEHEEQQSEAQKQEIIQDNADREEVHAVERAEANKTMSDTEQSTDVIKHGHVEPIQNNAAQISGNGISTESSNQINKSQESDDNSVGVIAGGSTEAQHDTQRMIHVQEKEEQQEVVVTKSEEDRRVLNEASDIVARDENTHTCQSALVYVNDTEVIEEAEKNKIVNNDLGTVNAEHSRPPWLAEEHVVVGESSDYQAANDSEKLQDKDDSQMIHSCVVVKDTVRNPGIEVQSDTAVSEGAKNELTADVEEANTLLLNNSIDADEHFEQREIEEVRAQNIDEVVENHEATDVKENVETAEGVKLWVVPPEDDETVQDGQREEKGDTEKPEDSTKQERTKETELVEENLVSNVESSSVDSSSAEAQQDSETNTKIHSIDYEDEFEVTKESTDNLNNSEEERLSEETAGDQQDSVTESEEGQAVVGRIQVEGENCAILNSSSECAENIIIAKKEVFDEGANNMLEVRLPTVSAEQSINDEMDDTEEQKQNSALRQPSIVSEAGSGDRRVGDVQNEELELTVVNVNTVTSEEEKNKIKEELLEDDIRPKGKIFQSGPPVEGNGLELKLQHSFEAETKSDKELSPKCSEDTGSPVKETEQQDNVNQDEHGAISKIKQDILSISSDMEIVGSKDEIYQVDDKRNELQTSEQGLLQKCNSTENEIKKSLCKDNIVDFKGTDAEMNGPEGRMEKYQTAGDENKDTVCTIQQVVAQNTDNEDLQKADGPMASIQENVGGPVEVQPEKVEEPPEEKVVKPTEVHLGTVGEPVEVSQQKVEELAEALSETIGNPDEAHPEKIEEPSNTYTETAEEPSDTHLEKVEELAEAHPENTEEPVEAQLQQVEEPTNAHSEEVKEPAGTYLENVREQSDTFLENVVEVAGADLEKVMKPAETNPEKAGELTEVYLEQVEKPTEEKVRESTETELKRVGELVEEDREKARDLAEVHPEKVGELTEKESEKVGKLVEEDPEKEVEPTGEHPEKVRVPTETEPEGSREPAKDKIEPAELEEKMEVDDDSIVNDGTTIETENLHMLQSNEDEASLKESKKGKGKNKEDCVIS